MIARFGGEVVSRARKEARRAGFSASASRRHRRSVARPNIVRGAWVSIGARVKPTVESHHRVEPGYGGQRLDGFIGP
ncbi:hypothetical protein GCM10011320_11500 [Neoroseomonas lacus]|uniref:Uncharacterized protein n=1 Tax=Neoroseomonas lacus TaxID=287609 RepID=A0A917KCX4_9PROT|nr:hypothetical protein GCM10011320_11500 [Neoroseomonas lacus]